MKKKEGRAGGGRAGNGGEEAAAGEPLLFVDAIEGDFARLLLGVEAFDVPTRLLPKEARAGSWLRLSLQVTEPPPDEGAAIRTRLGRGDDGGDIKL